MRKAIALLLIMTVAGFLISCGETTEPEKVESADTTESAAGEPTDTSEAPAESSEDGAQGEAVFSMGEMVKMDDLLLTVNSAHWDQGNDFAAPEAGVRWLVIDATIENTGSEAEQLSSLMTFKLMDEDGYSRDFEIMADTKGSLDGELGPGQKMRGQMAFSVDEGQQSWELVFEPNLFGSGQARFQFNAEEVQQGG